MEKVIDKNAALPYPLVVLVKDAPPEVSVDNTARKIVLSLPPKSKIRPTLIGPVLFHPELPPMKLIIGRNPAEVFARFEEVDVMLRGLIL